MNPTDNLRQLENSCLVSMVLEPSGQWLDLYFSFGPDGKDTTIRLWNIVSMLCHRIPSEEGDFYVGSVALKQCSDQDELLKSLNYPYKQTNTSLETSTQHVFCLTVEGGIDLQVVCKGYRIFRG